jgi:sulfocyanin
MKARHIFNETVLRPRRFLAIGALVLASVWALPSPRGGQAASRQPVEFTLVASGTGANGGFNFNGYSKGALTITVPVGRTVVIHYHNNGNLRHSLDVIAYAGKQPDKAPDPVFAGGSTKDRVDGIGIFQQETLTFAARRSGKYEFLCGVLGHAQAGMWDYLIVSPAATAPSVRPAGGVAFKTK